MPDIESPAIPHFPASVNAAIGMLCEGLGTRERILDKAEEKYAEGGAGELRIRSITKEAGVNLAAINYHFRSKQALIEATLLRVLQPIRRDMIDLLHRIERRYGHDARPTHIIAAMMLPIMREMRAQPTAHQRVQFLLRVTSDTDTIVRQYMATRFQGAELFDQAFARSAPNLPRDDAVWRARLLCSAQPGTIVNHSLIAMCQSLMARADITGAEVLRHFGFLAESTLTGYASRQHVDHLVVQVMETLGDTESAKELGNWLTQPDCCLQ